jgi:hypothetical protein
MRARTQSLDNDARPTLFSHPQFHGQIYQLDEPVFDTLSIVHALAEPYMDSILEVDGASFQTGDSRLGVNDKAGNHYQFKYKQLVLMAGSGNKALLAQLGRSQPEMQLRPLKMVMLRGGLGDTVYAHCLGASVNPRVTITSHYDDNNNIVWYLGGQLAEDGVKRSNDEQIKQAKAELAELIPWLDLSNSEWAVLDIDRAEVRKPDASRPDTFYSEQTGNVVTAWPTKLALAPQLARDVLQKITDSGITPCEGKLPSWPLANFAAFPWCEAERWSRA